MHNNNQIVIHELKSRMNNGLVYLAACGLKYRLLSNIDPLQPAWEIGTIYTTSSEEKYLSELSYESQMYLAGRFMIALAFNLSCHYGTSCQSSVQYIINRLVALAKEYGMMSVVPDICNDAVAELNRQQRIFEIIACQRVNEN